MVHVCVLVGMWCVVGHTLQKGCSIGRCGALCCADWCLCMSGPLRFLLAVFICVCICPVHLGPAPSGYNVLQQQLLAAVTGWPSGWPTLRKGLQVIARFQGRPHGLGYTCPFLVRPSVAVEC